MSFFDRSLEDCSVGAEARKFQDATLFPEVWHDRSKLEGPVMHLCADLEEGDEVDCCTALVRDSERALDVGESRDIGLGCDVLCKTLF